MVPRLPPSFVHTVNDQKLDGGKALLPDPSKSCLASFPGPGGGGAGDKAKSRCTAQFMSLMSTVNVLTDLDTLYLTSDMPQYQEEIYTSLFGYSHSPYSAYSSHCIFLYAPLPLLSLCRFRLAIGLSVGLVGLIVIIAVLVVCCCCCCCC